MRVYLKSEDFSKLTSGKVAVDGYYVIWLRLVHFMLFRHLAPFQTYPVSHFPSGQFGKRPYLSKTQHGYKL